MTSIEQLLQLLGWTLDPKLTKQATYQLESMKSINGFLRDLVMISQNSSITFHIRFSAIVYLKNTIQQLSKQSYFQLHQNHHDYEFVKNSLLEIMIILIQQNQQKLLQIMKQICFQLVRNEFRQNKKWDDLVNKLVNHIDKCQNQQSIKASLIVTKILFKILGKSLTQQVRLNNLANKLILPIVNLASKMYASLESMFSCSQLIEILKIFTQVIEFHLPQIVQKNIHVFMVLVKNLLELKVYQQINYQINDHQSQRIICLIKLKNETLTFLQKLYQRHATSNLLLLKDFIKQFNKKYTKPYFETIVSIIMQKPHINNISNNNNSIIIINKQNQQKIQKLNFSLGNHALGIFSFIASNKQSSKYILQQLDKYQLKILYLSIERFLLSAQSHKLQRRLDEIFKQKFLNNRQKLQSVKLFQNYTDFTQTISQQRLALRLFISTIFANKNILNRQKHINKILELLQKCIIQGSLKQQQLGIYLLSSLQKQIQMLAQDQQYYHLNKGNDNNDINQKMLQILKCHIPLLIIQLTAQNSQQIITYQQQHEHNQIKDSLYKTLIKLRCYQIYARFEYLQLAKQDTIQLCQQIYQQLSKPITNQLQLFVKIQCMQTFNLILSQHQELIPLLANNAGNILKIYTQMLQQQYQVIRFYDQILVLFSPYIGSIVYEILQLLSGMYFKLSANKMTKYNSLSVDLLYQQQKGQQYTSQQFYNNDENNDYDDYMYSTNNKSQQYQQNNQQDSDSEQTVYDDKQNKYDNIGTQCLSSIKKLLYKHDGIKLSNSQGNNSNNNNSLVNRINLADKLMLVGMNALTTKDEVFVKQGLSIINLLLYRGFVTEYYTSVFALFLYPTLLEINSNNINNININNNNLLLQRIHQYLQQTNQNQQQTNLLHQLSQQQQSQQHHYQLLYHQYYNQLLKQIYSTHNINNNHQQLQNIFQLSQIIGCLKNSIKWFSNRLNSLICPLINKSYMEMVMDIVVYKMEFKEDGFSNSNSERIAVLGVCEALVENRVFVVNGENSNNNTSTFTLTSTSNNNINHYLHKLISYVFNYSHPITNNNPLNQQPTKSNIINSQLQQSTILKLIMLICYYYPQQLYTYIQQQSINYINSNNMFIKESKQILYKEYLVEFVNVNIIGRISSIVKPLGEMFGGRKCYQQQQQIVYQIPVESYIVVKGLATFAHVLVDKLVFNNNSIRNNSFINKNQSHQLQDQLPQSLRILFTKLSLILNKLSIQICFFAFKQALGQQFQNQLSQQQLLSIQQTCQKIDKIKLFTQKINNNNNNNNDNNDNNQEQIEQYQRENMILAQMFNCLNIGGNNNNNNNNRYIHQSNNGNIFYNQQSNNGNNSCKNDNNGQHINFSIDNNINNSINNNNKSSIHYEQIHTQQQLIVNNNKPSSQQQFEQNYQKHINLTKQLSPQMLLQQFQQQFYSSQQSSQVTNPFERFDQQYLFAYDSPMIKMLQQKNKKVKLLIIMQQMMHIQMDKNIFYLRDVFEQGIRQRRRRQQQYC